MAQVQPANDAPGNVQNIPNQDNHFEEETKEIEKQYSAAKRRREIELKMQGELGVIQAQESQDRLFLGNEKLNKLPLSSVNGYKLATHEQFKAWISDLKEANRYKTSHIHSSVYDILKGFWPNTNCKQYKDAGYFKTWINYAKIWIVPCKSNLKYFTQDQQYFVAFSIIKTEDVHLENKMKKFGYDIWDLCMNEAMKACKESLLPIIFSATAANLENKYQNLKDNVLEGEACNIM